VYTPPQYDSEPNRQFPVLYLRHGSGDNEENWSDTGRASVILDNLIAQHKAVPMRDGACGQNRAERPVSEIVDKDPTLANLLTGSDLTIRMPVGGPGGKGEGKAEFEGRYSPTFHAYFEGADPNEWRRARYHEMVEVLAEYKNNWGRAQCPFDERERGLCVNRYLYEFQSNNAFPCANATGHLEEHILTAEA
jgi:hypothetical protein